MSSYAILINSCDSYSDLWDTFMFFLEKNWPEARSAHIYLNTESKKYTSSLLPVTVINTELTGKDMWGKRLLNALAQIEESNVVVLMDDFFLKEKINNNFFLYCMDLIDADDSIAVIYLTKILRHDFQESKYKGLCEIPKNTNYRLNSAPGIWKKEKLINYVNEHDDPWAWEYFGTCRTNKTNDRFFGLIKSNINVYEYAHVIYRGKWLGKNIKPLIAEYDLDIDLSKRGVLETDDICPKRSFNWKIKFIIAGFKMVGFEAIKEVIRDMRYEDSL